MEIRINQVEKRSWVEVDVAQLRKNYRIYKSHLNDDSQIMAVIKADAYGHGDVMVAKMLAEEGCRMFAVSNIDEAVGLRNAGIEGEILILGYSSVKYAKTMKFLDLTQAIVSEEYADTLAAAGFRNKCQFAIDTGMNRIGLDADNPDECERIIRKYSSSLDINGLFTHLCVADSNANDDKEFTLGQLRKFDGIASMVKDLNLPFLHCLNSAGGLYYQNQCENNSIVRLGIVLYGLKPDATNAIPEGIKSPLKWMSVVSMVKDVSVGESLGYGRTFKVEKPMRIAIVTTGYADGFDRHLSNKGFVLLHGQKAPVVGRICMDQTLVDVSHINDVKMGDRATLLGVDGEIEYNADDMAQELGTIGYEVLCNISKRVQRFYKINDLMVMSD